LFVVVEIIIRRQREDRQDRFLGAFFFSFLVSLSLFLTFRYFLDASFYYDRALGVLVVLSFFSLSRDLDLSLSVSLPRASALRWVMMMREKSVFS
jgi:hypothetical protein